MLIPVKPHTPVAYARYVRGFTREGRGFGLRNNGVLLEHVSEGNGMSMLTTDVKIYRQIAALGTESMIRQTSDGIFATC
jgi:hypothetical protein